MDFWNAMDFATASVAALLIVTIALVALLTLRPGLTVARGGKSWRSSPSSRCP